MSTRKPTAISLYTGAGGLDYGLEAAGFRTAVAIEMDGDCCRTLRHNRKWPVIERDIHAVPTDEILEAARLKRGEVDLVVGGPPCQPFSKSGYWANGDTERLADPRATTLDAFMRVVEETRPAAFLLENVEGLAYLKKNDGLRLITTRLKEINRKARVKYTPCYQVLSAADFGVPQMRERFFLVAARDGTQFDFPAVTHGTGTKRVGQMALGVCAPYMTAWDAIGDVEPDPSECLAPEGKWAGLWPSIPEGQNYLWHTDRGGGVPLFGWRRHFWSFLLKLAKARPSWTIQAQPGPATGPFHWANRRLSMRELCRLQTFPDDVTIVGNRISIQRQVGNAVPSLLAEVLGRAIRTQLLGLPAPRSAPRLLPPRREPLPPPEPVEPVPREYMRLKGVHAAHPGTGKGYRAQQWANGRASLEQ